MTIKENLCGGSQLKKNYLRVISLLNIFVSAKTLPVGSLFELHWWLNFTLTDKFKQ